jgi:hypothetical protein
MTPKEKASELIQKMIDTYDITSDFVYDSSAKLCAWIAVNEILSIDCWDMSEEHFVNHIEYWEEVKREIEKS